MSITRRKYNRFGERTDTVKSRPAITPKTKKTDPKDKRVWVSVNGRWELV